MKQCISQETPKIQKKILQAREQRCLKRPGRIVCDLTANVSSRSESFAEAAGGASAKRQ
jgi:hypothetical protein